MNLQPNIVEVGIEIIWVFEEDETLQISNSDTEMGFRGQQGKAEE